MAPNAKSQAAHETFPIPSPQLPLPLLPPPTSPSCPVSQDDHSAVGDVMETKDLRAHILSLPRKADLELFAHRVEKTFRQDIEAL